MANSTQKNTLKMYGIKNCDTIKKARRYLESHEVDYQFHDYRVDGLDAALLQTFKYTPADCTGKHLNKAIVMSSHPS